MLSYQHAYHAGNLADVHKHALLAAMLARMTAKPKPMCYIETHAGRGLYDLQDAAALKTGEAAQGIARTDGWFATDHPFARALHATRDQHGPAAYPGSPLVAGHLLRPGDRMDLIERHPAEVAALRPAVTPFGARVHAGDGYEIALSLTPPTPRRGLILIDPSYELPAEYLQMPRFIATLARKWNVGVIVLWYPILAQPRHQAMLDALTDAHPQALRHEVGFPPARPGHGMQGSGVFVLNPPYGLAQEAAALAGRFATLQPAARRRP
ncbi:MAG: 23S rRNA (adenine(2030)-N(6))-methyltransferase RlmJ [Pararhodobacter sp.]|nr:23S rRNA (adenine(2030)-N(6))-methyltransferase RlmJ [Pararhodobacter sp.]